MKNLHFKYLQIFCVMCFSMGVKAGYEGVPMPQGMKSVWVGEDIVQNGIPMQIQSFTYGGTVESLLSFYKTQWAKPQASEIPGFLVQQAGEWTIISHLETSEMTLVQVKAGNDNNSIGYISQATLGASSDVVELIREFPKMNGTDVISATESTDANKDTTTLILSNSFSVDSNSQYYKNKMKSMGWKYIHGAEQENTNVLLFNGKDSQAEIAISKNKNGTTIIFANVVGG
jgi:hypothetical protein